MTAWQQLAFLEWRRSILQGKPNLDFFWLTILLTLTLLLALLLWGGREGLLNKFVDVSIGYVENAGIPIWLATNQVEGIDRALLQELAAQKMTIYPYREVEWHQVDFPDHDPQIWRDKVTPFLGWAVSSTDPLWQAATVNPQQESTDLPLTIVLNQSLFSQHFDCKAYISALQRRSPLILSTIKDPANCLANDILWLDIRLGNTREVLPFHIRWQRHLPSIQPLAFLFPLSTLNTLIVANTEQALHYYPHIEGSRRIKQLILRTSDTESVSEMIAALSPCLPNATIEHRRITLASPLPDTWLAHCFVQYSKIPLHTQDSPRDPPYFKVTEFASTPYFFAYDRQQDWLTVTCPHCNPCEVIPSLKEKVIAQGCESRKATIDIFKAVGSYQRAFVYVENRLQLAKQLEELKNFPAPETTKAFYFHRTYDDALVRFKFIDKIMQLLELFFSPFFFIFVFILLIVQVGIVVAHRKHNYGILLAKGIAWKQIQWIVFLQLTLSFLFAIGGAVFISEGMQALLAGQLAHVTASPPYVDHIVTSGLDLLPLAIGDYLKVGGMILALLYITGFFLLKAIIAKHHQEPAYLFSAS